MVGKTQQYRSCAGRLQLHHGSLKTGRAICRAGPTQSHDSLLPPHSICLFLQPSLVQPQVYWLHLIFKSSLFSIWPPLTCCLPSSLPPPPPLSLQMASSLSLCTHGLSPSASSLLLQLIPPQQTSISRWSSDLSDPSLIDPLCCSLNLIPHTTKTSIYLLNSQSLDCTQTERSQAEPLSLRLSHDIVLQEV